jgi:NADPH:quinone reductase-like Zn-dependent oxidoreductase
MRAIVPANGEAFVELADVPAPEPSAGDVLVDVHAFSVNQGDLHYLAHAASLRPPGWRPCLDVAGVVRHAAADGTGPAVGTRVIGYSQSGGGGAQLIALPAEFVAPLPDEVDFATGAALPTAGLTAARMMRAAGPLFGRRVLVTAASGGVGHFLVEMAASAGAEVTAVASPAKPSKSLLDRGAVCVVARPAEAKGRFDVAFEGVGGATLGEALARVKPRGLLLWFGQGGGESVTLDFFSYFAGYEAAAVRQFVVYESEGTWNDDLAALGRLVAGGRLRPHIGLLDGWEATDEAFRRIAERRMQGKAVLKVQRESLPATRKR